VARADSPLLGRMVFVVGENRSGTNWLVRLLGLHPDVVVIPSESHLLSDGIAPLRSRVQHGVPTSPRTGAIFMDREVFLDAARNLCDLAFGAVAEALGSHGGRIIEHTPAHVRHLELIGDVYPDASVIHIIRDGRDVARSLVAQPWGPGSLAEAAQRWVDSVSGARAAASKLASYHEVRYEDLLVDPAGRMNALYEAIGLPASADLAEQVVREARIQFNSDVGDPRVGPGKWKGAWAPDELRVVEAIQRSLLSALGYPPPGPDDARRPSTAWARSLGSRPAARSARAAAGRMKRLKRLSGPGGRPAPGYRMDQAQGVVDRFFAELAAGNAEAAEDLLAPDAHVRTVTAGGVHDVRGTAARRVLRDVLVARTALIGPGNRPLRSETFVVHDRVAVILSFLDPAGRPVDELFLMAARDDTVTSIRYHRFPMAPG
jgi:ketosteroid isomerase-like protein